MPSRSTIKTYVQDGIYHVYNRGAGKQKVFFDDSDYQKLHYIIGDYLLPEVIKYNKDTGEKNSVTNFKSLHKEVKIFAYCLMPNHFHFILHQKNKDSMTKFMRRVFTKYSMYINKKYDRSGVLFQGRYKASLISEDSYLRYVSAYIHLNPIKDGLVNKPEDWKWSSYGNYIHSSKIKWINTKSFYKYAFEKSRKTVFNYKTILSEYHSVLRGDKEPYIMGF